MISVQGIVLGRIEDKYPAYLLVKPIIARMVSSSPGSLLLLPLHFLRTFSFFPPSTCSMEKRRTHGEVVENGMSNDYLAFDKLFDFCSNVFKEWCYTSALVLFLFTSREYQYPGRCLHGIDDWVMNRIRGEGGEKEWGTYHYLNHQVESH